MRFSLRVFLGLLVLALTLQSASCAPRASIIPENPELAPRDLPVIQPEIRGLQPLEFAKLTNLLSVDQLRNCLEGGSKNRLAIDFSSLTELLSGETIDPTRIEGSLVTGPWPFEEEETDFSYRRFRRGCSIKKGRGRLKVEPYCHERGNSEDWVDGGVLMLRFDLYEVQKGRDRSLGRYDFPLRFQLGTDRLLLLPVLDEGPMLCRLSSDSPGTAVVALSGDRHCAAGVEVRSTESPSFILLSYEETKTASERKHEVELAGLPTGVDLEYRVFLEGNPASEWIAFQLPDASGGSVRFAYFGDTRSGSGGGESAQGGVNLDTIENLTAIAYREKAEFFLVGGDLISGYTTSSEDFAGQLYAWKQAMAGFWRSRPVYPALGNHEALLRRYEGKGDEKWLGLDAWPYDLTSAEALFADAFCNPLNAPKADAALPTYSETVYSFRHGCVKSICFNNNYWFSSHADRYGGCPEGCMLEDQMAWIEAELASAEADPAIAHVLLYAQEPVFPCGGHVHDAMWYNGDNRVKPWRKTEVMGDEKNSRGKPGLEIVGAGIVDVRNRLLRALSTSTKVAAVLGSDEHSYYRILISPETPVGVMSLDDPDKNNQLNWPNEELSPLPGMKRSVWFLTCGGGGAPYYSEQKILWNQYWRKMGLADKQGEGGFYYSSQENLMLFDATPEKISMRVLNRYGELIDWIDDLRAEPSLGLLEKE